jgi:leucyl/phenylalanyl-tRNA---protein transferase
MPHVCFDEKNFSFPPVHEADEEGLLLIGGKVTPARVIEAYRKGIFPWYNEEALPLWWSPDPRFVLITRELHISRSMQKLLSKNVFEFRVDTAFSEVIQQCASISRKEQDGTWITDNMSDVYNSLHQAGFAHSAETWLDGKLVGGMYGIRLGKVFFGESMFSNTTNASKFAFIKFVQQLQQEGVELLDCQVYTPHVETLGARLIKRDLFLQLLENLIE